MMSPAPAKIRFAPGGSRRGFTVLELSLAAVVGGLLVLSAFGVFNALDRSERTLKARFEQSSELARLHTVMRRTFVSLAMSTKNPAPAPRNGASGPANAPSSSALQGSNAAGAGKSRQGGPGGGAATDAASAQALRDAGLLPSGETATPRRDPPPEPARVVLTQDRRVEAPSMSLLHGVGVEVGADVPQEWKPQRLEVVLSRPPVPIPRGAELSAFPEAGAGREDLTDEEVSGSTLYRGIFELTPVAPGTRGPRGERPRNFQTWALWWRPMPPAAKFGGAEGEVREYELSKPMLVASDLSYVRWQFFDDRIRKTEFATAYVKELPAYVEMDVQTASGLWANWLFEVDFLMSNEEGGDASDSSDGRKTTVRAMTASKKGGGANPKGGAKGGGS